jgi:protocatechuate 3,4-dioxygenase beta subunit
MFGWILVVLTAVLTSVAALMAQEQANRVLGRVTDASGRPLRDAAVVLEPRDNPGPAVTTTSGVSGGYQFLSLRPGLYTLRTEHSGYRAAERQVRVREGVVLVPAVRLPARRPLAQSARLQ